MSKYIVLFLFFLPTLAFSQMLEGQVADSKGKPLFGAKVFWVGTKIGTSTDSNGNFKISLQGVTDQRLTIKYLGFKTDTFSAILGRPTAYILDEITLQGVVVTGKRSDTYMTKEGSEVLTAKELGKGACCDLAGCFGTNASVQPTTTNVITNSQELRILGLSGIYNQVLFEGLPLIQGLSYTYGISSIPGPFVENIYVAKGATSVLQGYEGISGQINVIPKEQGKTDKLFLNVYMNSFLEKQFNAIYTTPVRKKGWSNLLAFHTAQPGMKEDRDHDNFLDMPLLTRYVVYDKLKYGDDNSFGWHSNIGIMYLNEQRIGGQLDFNPAIDKGSSSVYGQTVNISQPTIYTKTAYRLNEDETISLYGSFFQHNQNDWYGQTKYQAQQQSAYANLQYELRWAHEHSLKTGISLRNFDLDENISFSANPLNKTFAGDYRKTEFIPGAFAENTFNFKDDKISLLTGVRLDRHNQFGYFFTPRTMLRVSPGTKTIIRASAGTGWRTVNIFSENVNLLASQRNVIFTQPLQPERAANYGINIMRNFETESIKAFISADFYRTQFLNQIFPDYDTDPDKAFISNFTGVSASNGFQTDLSATFKKVFSAKVSYNYLDVYRMINNQKYTLPFNPLHKVLITLSYKPVNEKWHFDVNIHWYGQQTLPNTSELPADLQRSSKSQPYSLMNAQFTKSWKKLDLYIGCENIFDYRQYQPILSWQNPFSPYFDTSSAWGPTRGREFYLGARFKLN